MRDNDTLILENLYSSMLFEFTEKTIQKLVTKFTKENPNLSETIITSYLDRFEKVKSSPKVKKKDPFQYTWKELENFLDANFPPEEEKTGSEEDEKEKLKVYEDKDIIVYRAKNTRQAQILGDGFTFCISRIGSGNMYSYYRLNYQSSFYFIRFKKKSDKKEGTRFENPLFYIVLDINNDGRIQLTGADNGSQGNGTAYIDKERLLERFPELEEPFKKSVFEKMPLTEEEKEKYKKFKEAQNLITYTNNEILSFKNRFNELKYSEKKEYLQSGYEFPSTLFGILDKSLRADYLNNAPILDKPAVDKLTESEKNRWTVVLLRKNEERDSEEKIFTYLLNHLTGSPLANYRTPAPNILMEAILKYIKKGKSFQEPRAFIDYLESKQRELVWNTRINNDQYLSNLEKDLLKKYLPWVYRKYESIVKANSEMRLKQNNFDNMHEEEVEYIAKNKLASEEQLLEIVDKKLLPDAYTDLAATVFQNIDYKKHIPRILDIFDQQTFKYENDKIYFQEWQGDFGSFLQDIQDYVDQEDYTTYLPYYIGDEFLDIDVPYNTLDSNTIESFLDILQKRSPDLYKTLDAHMRLLYKEQHDVTAEEDGYDLEDIIEQGLDDDIKTAFFRAYTSAMEYGASNEIYKEFQSFAKELPFYYDEGEGGSVRGYLTPEQFYELIIVPESLEVLYNGENVLEIMKQEGEFPKFNVPYYGFDGYDEEAGLETLINELQDALP